MADESGQDPPPAYYPPAGDQGAAGFAPPPGQYPPPQAAPTAGFAPPPGQYPPPQAAITAGFAPQPVQYPPPQAAPTVGCAPPPGQYPPRQGQYGQPVGAPYGQPAQYYAQPVVSVQPPATTTLVSGRGCSRCGGVLTEDFTGLGICLAVCFFPLGVICCLLLQEKRCINCGATY